MSARITVDRPLVEFAIWALRKSNYLECANSLESALSTEPGEADPFEHCAREAEAQAELVEQMRGVYPGDPHGALGRDANKMRRLAKSIRQLRPAAPLPEDTHHG